MMREVLQRRFSRLLEGGADEAAAEAKPDADGRRSRARCRPGPTSS